MAGHDWLELFLKRHTEISLLKPEGTSQKRISAFHKTEVDRFFNNLLTVIETNLTLLCFMFCVNVKEFPHDMTRV
jgi:hypothetical protein